MNGTYLKAPPSSRLHLRYINPSLLSSLSSAQNCCPFRTLDLCARFDHTISTMPVLISLRMPSSFLAPVHLLLRLEYTLRLKDFAFAAKVHTAPIIGSFIAISHECAGAEYRCPESAIPHLPSLMCCYAEPVETTTNSP